MSRQAITLAWTGASGMPYGLRLLECLLRAGQTVYLLISDAARVVLKLEADLALPGRTADAQRLLAERFRAPAERLRVFGQAEWTAPVASGSGAPRRMVICPCTTGTLAAVAAGSSDNLIERAADVVLKERGQLILVVRETPLSELHLENMLRLARMGAVMLPANPGFYHRPARIEDLVDFIVARTLDHLGIDHDLIPPWGDGDDTA
ncbi:MAG: UbiX family flavin prenyltransferase [Xanthomonadaceae bacterium]|nr:UbiX family flavin prenyltransferase [Xanthomonadaceae bacterium]